MTHENLEKEVAQMIIDCLSLEDITAEEINPEEALFNEGLGLDSIDALELSVSLSKTYGIELRNNDTNNKEIFSSLSSLADYIAKNSNK
ncbi:MAG: phosphopantetheine-binding protein [Gammaproteobacteria bacterium]|nr:phosphopantetheine-binding protein [Gammaproteobacteria bacterium]